MRCLHWREWISVRWDGCFGYFVISSKRDRSLAKRFCGQFNGQLPGVILERTSVHLHNFLISPIIYIDKTIWIVWKVLQHESFALRLPTTWPCGRSEAFVKGRSGFQWDLGLREVRSETLGGASLGDASRRRAECVLLCLGELFLVFFFFFFFFFFF